MVTYGISVFSFVLALSSVTITECGKQTRKTLLSRNATVFSSQTGNTSTAETRSTEGEDVEPIPGQMLIPSWRCGPRNPWTNKLEGECFHYLKGAFCCGTDGWCSRSGEPRYNLQCEGNLDIDFRSKSAPTFKEFFKKKVKIISERDPKDLTSDENKKYRIGGFQKIEKLESCTPNGRSYSNIAEHTSLERIFITVVHKEALADITAASGGIISRSARMVTYSRGARMDVCNTGNKETSYITFAGMDGYHDGYQPSGVNKATSNNPWIAIKELEFKFFYQKYIEEDKIKITDGKGRVTLVGFIEVHPEYDTDVEFDMTFEVDPERQANQLVTINLKGRSITATRFVGYFGLEIGSLYPDGTLDHVSSSINHLQFDEATLTFVPGSEKFFSAFVTGTVKNSLLDGIDQLTVFCSYEITKDTNCALVGKETVQPYGAINPGVQGLFKRYIPLDRSDISIVPSVNQRLFFLSSNGTLDDVSALPWYDDIKNNIVNTDQEERDTSDNNVNLQSKQMATEEGISAKTSFRYRKDGSGTFTNKYLVDMFTTGNSIRFSFPDLPSRTIKEHLEMVLSTYSASYHSISHEFTTWVEQSNTKMILNYVDVDVDVKVNFKPLLTNKTFSRDEGFRLVKGLDCTNIRESSINVKKVSGDVYTVEGEGNEEFLGYDSHYKVTDIGNAIITINVPSNRLLMMAFDKQLGNGAAMDQNPEAESDGSYQVYKTPDYLPNWKNISLTAVVLETDLMKQNDFLFVAGAAIGEISDAKFATYLYREGHHLETRSCLYKDNGGNLKDIVDSVYGRPFIDQAWIGYQGIGFLFSRELEAADVDLCKGWESYHPSYTDPDQQRSSEYDTSKNWGELAGKLKQISIGVDGQIWGTNTNDEVYRRKDPIDKNNPKTGGWEYISEKKMKYVAVGRYKVMAVNSDDEIFYRKGVSRSTPSGNGWEKIDGKLVQLSIGEDGKIIGVNSAGNVYIRLGVTRDNRGKPEGTEWKQIDGDLAHISVQGSKLVGVDREGVIKFRRGMMTNGGGLEDYGTHWETIPGRLTQIHVDKQGNIFGVNVENDVYVRAGVSGESEFGTEWRNFPDKKLAHITGNDGKLMGLGEADQIYIYGTANLETPAQKIAVKIQDIKFESCVVEITEAAEGDCEEWEVTGNERTCKLKKIIETKVYETIKACSYLQNVFPSNRLEVTLRGWMDEFEMELYSDTMDYAGETPKSHVLNDVNLVGEPASYPFYMQPVNLRYQIKPKVPRQPKEGIIDLLTIFIELSILNSDEITSYPAKITIGEDMFNFKIMSVDRPLDHLSVFSSNMLDDQVSFGVWSDLTNKRFDVFAKDGKVIMEVAGGLILKNPSVNRKNQIRFGNSKLARSFIDTSGVQRGSKFFACKESRRRPRFNQLLNVLGLGKNWKDFFEGSRIKDLCIGYHSTASCVTHNTEYIGGGNVQLQLSSETACMEECQQRQDCIVWTFGDNKCFLHDKITELRRRNSYTSGPVQCEWKYESRTFAPGFSVDGFVETDLRQGGELKSLPLKSMMNRDLRNQKRFEVCVTLPVQKWGGLVPTVGSNMEDTKFNEAEMDPGDITDVRTGQDILSDHFKCSFEVGFDTGNRYPDRLSQSVNTRQDCVDFCTEKKKEINYQDINGVTVQNQNNGWFMCWCIQGMTNMKKTEPPMTGFETCFLTDNKTHLIEMYTGKGQGEESGPLYCYRPSGSNINGDSKMWLRGYLKTFAFELENAVIEVRVVTMRESGAIRLKYRLRFVNDDLDRRVENDSGEERSILLYNEIMGTVLLTTRIVNEISNIKFQFEIKIPRESLQTADIMADVLEALKELVDRDKAPVERLRGEFARLVSDFDAKIRAADDELRRYTKKIKKSYQRFQVESMQRARAMRAYKKDCTNECGYVRIPGWTADDKCSTTHHGEQMSCMKFNKDVDVASNVNCISNCEAERTKSFIEAREANAKTRNLGSVVDSNTHCNRLGQIYKSKLEEFRGKAYGYYNVAGNLLVAYNAIVQDTRRRTAAESFVNKFKGSIKMEKRLNVDERELPDPRCMIFNWTYENRNNQDPVQDYTFREQLCFNGFVMDLVEKTYNRVHRSGLQSHFDTMEGQDTMLQLVLNMAGENDESNEVLALKELFDNCDTGTSNKRSIDSLRPFELSEFTVFGESTVESFEKQSPWTVAKKRDVLGILSSPESRLPRKNVSYPENENACSAARRAAIEYSNIASYIHKWVQEQETAKRSLLAMKENAEQDRQGTWLSSYLTAKNVSLPQVERMKYWTDRTKEGMKEWVAFQDEQIKRYNKESLPFIRDQLKYAYADDIHRSLKDFFTQRGVDGNNSFKRANIDASSSFSELSKTLLETLENGKTLDEISAPIEDVVRRTDVLQKRTIQCSA